MSEQEPSGGHPGERLMIVGGIVTVVGMILTFVAMVPLANSKWNMPSVFWSLAMVTGIGLFLLLWGLWRAARSRSKTIRAAAAEFDRGQPTESLPTDSQ
jgi:protein-S-isoprenylcysteine O-methyltransferase Ste14